MEEDVEVEAQEGRARYLRWFRILHTDPFVSALAAGITGAAITAAISWWLLGGEEQVFLPTAQEAACQGLCLPPDRGVGRYFALVFADLEATTPIDSLGLRVKLGRLMVSTLDRKSLLLEELSVYDPTLLDRGGHNVAFGGGNNVAVDGGSVSTNLADIGCRIRVDTLLPPESFLRDDKKVPILVRVQDLTPTQPCSIRRG